MVVLSASRAGDQLEGLQPFQPRYHLRQVAELISNAFAAELDASGRSALQEMQVVGRLSPVLGGVLSSAMFSDYFSGFVWVEDGQVLGNTTFQRIAEAPSRWRISNVAVAPGHRGKGIARRMMEATLGEIAERGGSWATLQVRVDNAPALHLYRSLKFTDVCREGLWRLPMRPANPPPPEPGVELRPLRLAHWRERLSLAYAAQDDGAQWAEPVRPELYQPSLGNLFRLALGNVSRLEQIRSWGVWDEDGLVGAVEAVNHQVGGEHTMRFQVHPDAQGQVEKALVARGLGALASAPPRAVIVSHSGDHEAGVEALEAAGFRAQYVLLTMRRWMDAAQSE